MALFGYQQITQRLLQDTKQQRFNIFDLRDWINLARGQAAAEGEAIRFLGTLQMTTAVQNYLFSNITGMPSGVIGIIAVRHIWNTTAGHVSLIAPREWEQMILASLATPTIANAQPIFWSQLGPGMTSGLYFAPPPDAAYTLQADCVGVPANLLTDADVELLPYPFQDAVPYFAAYMALLAVGEFEKADRMFELYERFMIRARGQATPTVLPRQYPGGEQAREAATHTGILNPVGLGRSNPTNAANAGR